MKNRARNRHLLGAMALSIFAIAYAPASSTATRPSTQLATTTLVNPTAAWSYYASVPNPNTHTAGLTAWATVPPEIKELARGLGAEQAAAQTISADQYAARVFEYVRNNIAVEFRFGLGKGARGAIIDQSGTAFDQAHLMVELLRQGNVTASYRAGTITLNAQEFGQWTGLVTSLAQATPPALPTFTVNAQAACQFLADGGIPATVNGATSCASLTGNLTTVTLGHIWVAANSKLYDSSFKRYNLRQGLDLAQRMGCGTDAAPTCGASANTAAMTGAISGTLAGAATLRNINEAQLASQLQTFATNLQSYVEVNLPDSRLEEVIGGRLIDDLYAPAPIVTLPYPSSEQLSWTGNIPDPFRTRVRIHYRAMDARMFADELSGRRIDFSQVRNLQDTEDRVLVIDDELKAVDPFPTVPTPAQLEITVDHPYAADGGAYADGMQNWTLAIREHSQAIIFALGDTGIGTARHFSDREQASPQTRYLSFIPTIPTYETAAQGTVTGAQLLYHESLAAKVVEGVSKARITQHHAVGVAGSNSFTLESKFSITSSQNDPAKRAAAFENLAVVGSMIEGSLLQQQQDVWSPSSAVAYFSIDNFRGIAFVNVTAANFSAVLPSLTSYYPSGSLQAMFNEGYEFILPQTGNIDNVGYPLIHGRYYTSGMGHLAYRGNSIAYLLNDYLKGGKAAPGADNPLKAALDSTKPGNHGLRRRKDISVNLASGEFALTPPPDIVSGAGTFPAALPFQRTYQSSNTYSELLPAPWSGSGYFRPSGYLGDRRGYYGSDSNSFAHLGGGWTHNYQITANLTNDGAIGLGSDRGIDALAAIAALYTITNLTESNGFERRLTAAFTAHWLSQRFMANVATVQRLPSSSTFVRLPGGAFHRPQGSAEQLVQTGNRSTAVCLRCADGELIIREPLTSFDYQAINLAYTDSLGSTISFTPSQKITVALPSGFAELWRPTFTADSWVFPDGMRINFQYQLMDSTSIPTRVLTSVSNSLGRSLTFTSTDLDPGAQNPRMRSITRVTDETGRFVSFSSNCTPSGTNPDALVGPWSAGPYGCRAFEVTAPDGARTIYSYEPNAASPETGVQSRPNYRLRRWFTPDDHGTPFLTVEYDSLYRVKGVRDKDGFRTSYFLTGLFGGEYRHRAETLDALAAVTTSYFDTRGRVLSTIDPLNRATYHSYDVSGRLVRTTYPETNSVEYEYDVRHNITLTRQKAKFSAGLADIVTRTTYAEGPTVRVCAAPKTCNRVVSTTDALDNVTTYTYSSATGQLLTISEPTVPLGSSTGVPLTTLCYTTYAVGGASVSLLTGKIERVTGSANRVTAYAYNSANKYVLSSVIVDPTVMLSAPATSSPTCPTSTKSGALNFATALTFDAIGNISSIDGPRADVTDVTNFTFDSMRRITRASAPLNSTTRYTYTLDGALHTIRRALVASPMDSNPANPRPTDLITAQWQTRTQDYWPMGELRSVTDAENNVTQYTYDPVGRLVLTIDPDNRRTGTVYDAAGQVRCTWKGWNGSTPPTSCTWNPATYVSNGSNGPLRYADYTFTENGKQRRVQDAGNNVTEYAYDGFDRLAFTLFPHPGTGNRCTVSSLVTPTTVPACPGTAPDQPTYERSTYDPMNNRLTFRTRNAQTITWTYDSLNRIRTKEAAALPLVTYEYNLLDEPTALTSPASGGIAAHSTTYDYDAAGRKLYEENLLNGVTRRVSYQYDAAGNRRGTTWPDTYSVTYAYNALNRMTQALEGAVKLADYDYDILSRRKQLKFANQSGNRMDYTYEADSNLDLLTNVLNTVTVTLNYGHNRSGQINSIVASDDFYLPSPAAAATVAYAPDKLNRYGSIGGQAATYDNNGNLLSWFQNGLKQTYTYDSENRLRTAAVDGGTTPTITYDYDALGRRISKLVGATATYFLLDGAEEIAEYSGTNAVLRRYITGAALDDRIAAAEGSSLNNPPKTYYHTNHQGSVIAMTDSAGNGAGCAVDINCQKLSYDEFGNLADGSVALGQPYRYVGRRFDVETGLYYYRARYYSPVLGRFLQADPVGYKDDLNLYAYVGNDPLNSTDPSGLCAEKTKVTGSHIPVCKDKVAWGQEQNIGDGFTARADIEPRAPTKAGFEIHVFKNGNEVGIFSGGRFVGRHGFKANVIPKGFGQTQMNALKGLDLAAGRLLGFYPLKGTANVKGADYPERVAKVKPPKIPKLPSQAGSALTAGIALYQLQQDPSWDKAKEVGGEILIEGICGLMGGCGEAETPVIMTEEGT